MFNTASFNFSRPKNLQKVHVWAGINLQGPTKIYIFEGIMNNVNIL